MHKTIVLGFGAAFVWVFDMDGQLKRFMSLTKNIRDLPIRPMKIKIPCEELNIYCAIAAKSAECSILFTASFVVFSAYPSMICFIA